MATEPKNPVKTTETTLEILEGLMRLDGAGVTELADHVGIAKSAVHNHLTTLLQHDYVVREGSGEYRVGLRFLELGGYARDKMALHHVAEPELKRVAAETHERTNLMVEEGGVGIYLIREKGDQAVSVNSYLGMRTYLHTTALGKALLAFMPDERVDEIIDRHGLPTETENTIGTRAELEETLEVVRERGFAFDDEERFKGIRCVAVPILNSEDEVIASLSASAPMRRMKDEWFREEVPELLLDAANIIELSLTHP